MTATEPILGQHKWTGPEKSSKFRLFSEPESQGEILVYMRVCDAMQNEEHFIDNKLFKCKTHLLFHLTYIYIITLISTL